MSSNTNTLFWVITGAVVVLGIFLLTNNSSSDSMSTISNKFDGIYKEQVSKFEETSDKEDNESDIEEGIEEDIEIPDNNLFLTEEEIREHEEYLKKSTMDYCKKPTINMEGFVVKHVSTDINDFVVDIYNNRSSDILNFKVRVKLYTCSDDQEFKSCVFNTQRIKAGSSYRFTCAGYSSSSLTMDTSRFYAIFESTV